MNSKRVVFLLLAVIVAGATAFLARAWLQNERQALIDAANQHQPIVQAPQLQVLVAKQDIRVGQIVKPDHLRWQPWPAGTVPSTYIVEGKRKEADFVGAVARATIAAGEPISESRLVLANSRGFMAAVLQPGLRAVSMPVTATTSVSGFIYAGDRVDVLLTHVISNGQTQHNVTETILRNARVIAMDQKVDVSPSDKPDVAKTATLELTAKQSEIVTLAQKMGDLSLVLRSLQPMGGADPDAPVDENALAEPGDSHIQDVELSRLISSNQAAVTPLEAARSVVVLRGSTSARQETDTPTPAPDPKADAKTNKPNPSPKPTPGG